jgi:TatD DNase family protein
MARPEEAFEPEAEVETFSTIHSVGPEPALAAVDTHCHLFLMEEDPGEVVNSANAAGVGRMVCVGIDPATSRRSLELAESYRGVFATAGVHPHTASDFDDRAGSEVEELLAHPLVVGVGETGLDYYRRLSPIEDQQRAFRTHISLSRESGKPLVVHVRDAWEDAMAILRDEGAERVVLHCFTGDEAIAIEAGRRGYVVSFAGNVTYPTAEHMRLAAAALPDGHLVCETDSPFLAPQRARGTTNAPANVLAVIQAVAEARGVTLDEMVEATTHSALAAFPLLR